MAQILEIKETQSYRDRKVEQLSMELFKKKPLSKEMIENLTAYITASVDVVQCKPYMDGLYVLWDTGLVEMNGIRARKVCRGEIIRTFAQAKALLSGN